MPITARLPKIYGRQHLIKSNLTPTTPRDDQSLRQLTRDLAAILNLPTMPTTSNTTLL